MNLCVRHGPHRVEARPWGHLPSRLARQWEPPRHHRCATCLPARTPRRSSRPLFQWMDSALPPLPRSRWVSPHSASIGQQSCGKGSSSPAAPPGFEPILAVSGTSNSQPISEAELSKNTKRANESVLSAKIGLLDTAHSPSLVQDSIGPPGIPGNRLEATSSPHQPQPEHCLFPLPNLKRWHRYRKRSPIQFLRSHLPPLPQWRHLGQFQLEFKTFHCNLPPPPPPPKPFHPSHRKRRDRYAERCPTRGPGQPSRRPTTPVNSSARFTPLLPPQPIDRTPGLPRHCSGA